MVKESEEDRVWKESLYGKGRGDQGKDVRVWWGAGECKVPCMGTPFLVNRQADRQTHKTTFPSHNFCWQVVIKINLH